MTLIYLGHAYCLHGIKSAPYANELDAYMQTNDQPPGGIPLSLYSLPFLAFYLEQKVKHGNTKKTFIIKSMNSIISCTVNIYRENIALYWLWTVCILVLYVSRYRHCTRNSVRVTWNCYKNNINSKNVYTYTGKLKFTTQSCDNAFAFVFSWYEHSFTLSLYGQCHDVLRSVQYPSVLSHCVSSSALRSVCWSWYG